MDFSDGLLIWTMVLNILVFAVSGQLLNSVVYTVWRFNGNPKREASRAQTVGLNILIPTTLACIMLSVVAILYMAMGITPVDILGFIRVRAPISANRGLFMIGTRVLLILLLIACSWLVHDIKERHFPRAGHSGLNPDQRATDNAQRSNDGCDEE